MGNLLYEKEAYEIIGTCMEVYNTLGYGFSEIIYKDALEIEFQQRSIPYQREKKVPVIYKSHILRSYPPDYILYDKIILEVKSCDKGIVNDSIKQILNYLKATGFKLGLAANFGTSKLEYKRYIR